jgi:hypothetical protein
MAKAINIQHADIVRHRDGKTYRVSEVRRSDIGDGLDRIIIAKEGEGAVFSGTAEQAREQGFAFGNEEFYSHARPISHFDIGTIVSNAERQFIGDLVGDEALASIVQFAISAGPEIVRLQTEVREANRLRVAAREDMDRFKARVHEQVEAARKEHDLCIDGCNSFLEELGLPLLKKKWTGTVTRDSDGEVILTVTGIEADDEEAAKEELQENFSVTATVKSVHFDYEYEGEGEADWETSDYDDDDWDETDDDIASNHEDNLTFSVEEE